MIYKKTKNCFCAIKIGNVKINSISKSIKRLRLEEKANFVLFNLNCTPSLKHLEYCIEFLSKNNNLNAMDFLKKLTGEKQTEKIEKKIELDKTKECCLIIFESNQKTTKKRMKTLCKVFGLKEKKLIDSKSRLKKLALKEKINKKMLKGFGEDFYSSINNFFIERSALVIK